MRTSLWLTPLLAFMAASQAYQAWETSQRLRSLETRGAWAAENERIDDQLAARSSERATAQARELKDLKDQLQRLGHWRSEVDSFAALTRSSERSLREEIRRSLTSVANTRPTGAEQEGDKITAKLTPLEGHIGRASSMVVGEMSEVCES